MAQDDKGFDQSRETPVEAPRGMYPGRLDDKGRLKLPAQFQHFFNSLTEKKFFVTSLDRRIAQIYPMTVWRENEKFFETYRENPAVAQDVAFTANDLGADGEMDSQGRILFNPELRRELGLEDQALHLFSYKGRVQVLTEAIYQERRQRASKAASDNVEMLERAGLK
jgi:transcriptional regulator MraZ